MQRPEDTSMPETHPNLLLHHLHSLAGSIQASAPADGQLLERFLNRCDETAVEALVRRYGSLVFGVCRRVLRDAHAAEDAFQATFLVLVRRAPSLDRRKPLGGWLYTVAYRLALRARARELRRRQCEERAAGRRDLAEGGAPCPSDLVVAVEEELHRLPERHRAPLVLCYLEGKTNAQAAELLGCARGSVAARLARARERLRERLARRGFVAPAAGVAAALATAARAAVPPSLLGGTVRAALWFARDGAAATGPVSARAVALARGASRAESLTRLKVAAALLLAVVVLATGATVLLKAAPQAGPPPRADDPPPSEPRPQRDESPRPAADRGANAAVPYGQAFLALRRGVGDEEKLIAECQTMPLDAHARELVARAAYALREMHDGAALPGCDWGSALQPGIDIHYSHGDGARVLSALACLRARLRFEDGQGAGAIDDVIAALALARHVSQDGTLDSLWAGDEIEQRLSETLALYLPRLDAQTVKDLRTRLDALPPAGRPATPTMRMEEAMLNWIAGEVREAKDRERLLAFLSQLAGFKADSPEKNRAKGRALLEACGGTPEGVLKFVEEMRPASVPLAKKLDLPADQVDKEFEREEKKLAGNPVFQVFAPVLHNVRSRQARAEVRRALLSAALAVRLDGRDALKNHPDPVGGGPFQYAAFDGGFELRSRLKQDERPLSLTVGRRGD
jgi:RNA polymerase sigma factor (sigma-70 family)